MKWYVIWKLDGVLSVNEHPNAMHAMSHVVELRTIHGDEVSIQLIHGKEYDIGWKNKPKVQGLNLTVTPWDPKKKG